MTEGHHPGADPGSRPRFNEAPRLETERLILRAWRKEDFRPWHAIMREPQVHKHFGPEPIGAEECWRRLSGAVGSWPMVGFGGWAVTLRETGELVGNVGLFNAWRAFEPEFGEEPEMGWIFSPKVHGQGVAFEACEAALHWAEENLASTSIWAIIAPANEPSLKLADRLRFERVSETLYNGDPTVVLKRRAW